MNALVLRPGLARNVVWALLAVVLVMYAFPFAYLILTSFKPPLDAISTSPTVWPQSWTLVNYRSALGTSGVPAAFINSVVTAAISTVLSLVLAVPAAYGVIRYGTYTGRGLHHAGTGRPHDPAGRDRRAAGQHHGEAAPDRHVVRPGPGADDNLPPAVDMADGELLRGSAAGAGRGGAGRWLRPGDGPCAG